MVSVLSERSQDMASTSMNHYEKQLYSVFKTFDVDNEEALDRSAVLQLCDTLQLEDRGAVLVDTLFERNSDRVTFTQFRNGLLSVLGNDSVPRPELAAAAEGDPAHHSDDSSGREVAPKFVFGSKKYGRRSRPQRAAADDSPRHRVASESRLDCARSRQRMRCKRSASAMESRDDAADLDHDRRVDRHRALSLCRGLHMHAVDPELVDRIFDASSADEISVGEFFDRLNSSLTTSIAASLDGVMVDDNSKLTEIISSDAVVDAWERAGVERPRRLLIELGFTAAGLRPQELERALDDELRALTVPADNSPDARALLLLASNALARLRLETTWHLLDVARAERDKLRDDLAEANRRARLLAQDVDENHARIEAELKASLRQVEARHAEAARAAAADAAAERERAAAARHSLEEEAARRAESETRLRAETASLRERIDDLQDRVRAAEMRAQQAEREQTRLQEEVKSVERRAGDAAEASRGALAELEARVLELRAEGQSLRDRNDELCAALEATARDAAGDAARAPSWRDEVAMQDLPMQTDVVNKQENSDPSLSPKARKVFDTSEMMRRMRQIVDTVARLPLQLKEGCQMCSTVGKTVTSVQKMMQELDDDIVWPDTSHQNASSSDVALQTEPTVNDEDVEALKKDLSEAKQQHETEKHNLTSVIKELETSLEQMKLEYDKCEEYWTCKLDDERELFAEEQRAGDERLADLVAKIADYERQFEPRPAPAAPAGLPTIDETYSLELQFSDLEDEFAKYRKEKEAELAAKMEEIEQLKSKIDDLERRHSVPVNVELAPQTCACGAAGGGGAGGASAGGGGGGGAGAGGAAVGAARWREAGALRARAARAERAAQRLHARLAAADLLVKDLYIENCRLAHLPRLPPARLP